MFKFRRLSIIFKTNWKNVINETLPKDNSSLLTSTNVDDIFTGIIFIVISSLFYCIFDIKTVSIVLAILRLIICGLLLVLLNRYKEKEVNAVIIFIVFVISSLNMLASLIASIMYLPAIFGYFINSLVLIIKNVGNLIGFAFLVSTSIDFLKKARKEYEEEHYIERKEDIVLKTIDINDVSMHATTKCDNCNRLVNASDMFCSFCGKKLK